MLYPPPLLAELAAAVTSKEVMMFRPAPPCPAPPLSACVDCGHWHPVGMGARGNGRKGDWAEGGMGVSGNGRKWEWA